jgi:nucleosome binding factor SPN SPT16 subunit
VDVSPFSLLNYISQSDSNKNLLNVRTINEIDIQIYDENENLINFNNLDWTITLVISSEVKINIRDSELTLNNTLNKNLLRLNQLETPVEEVKDEIITPPEDPLKLQNLKELEILNS